MTESTRDIIARYRQGAIANGDISDPKKANKGAKQLHACYKLLREYEEGRKALSNLMGDQEPSVRCWAASHCLQWSPVSARRTLEALQDSKGRYSITAEMTLQEYDEGRLTFDY
jgi:hypothetical protein